MLTCQTRNVSLEAMDKVFKSNDAVRDAELMHSIMTRLHADANAASSDKSSEQGYSKILEKV